MKNKRALLIIGAIIFCAFQTTVGAQNSDKDHLPLASTDAIFTRPTNPSEPIVVPPISFVDVNSGRFGKLEIDLEDAQFYDTAADKLHLIARNFDVQSGMLKSLDIDIQGGHLRDFIFDKLKMETAGDLKFDSGILINHRLLQFEQPAQANVVVTISQASLNQFLSSPKTLEHLSISATRKAGTLANLATLVGIKINQVGFTIDSASIKLLRHDQFKLDFSSKVGLGDLGLPINGQIEGKLALQDGSLVITEPHVLTGGQEIPQELSNFLIKKINLIPTNSQKSQDIRFNFTEMKVSAGKQIRLTGTAYVSRLRFGNNKKG